MGISALRSGFTRTAILLLAPTCVGLSACHGGESNSAHGLSCPLLLQIPTVQGRRLTALSGTLGILTECRICLRTFPWLVRGLSPRRFWLSRKSLQIRQL
ncbi:MAG: hypothetical protein IJ767_04325 [Bacteroidaceae bacterium]|nr:hypothetical protein [Bacteroidaceae bacterium]